jgi:TRAP-type uncharacterized transport system fused permease subunit
VIGIALSLFHLYAAGVQPLGLFYQRPIHLGFILVLCFLIYPVWGKSRPRGPLGWIIDGTLIACSVVVGAWLPVNIDTIANQIFPRQSDVVVGVLTVLVVLEAARRAVGLGMTIIGVCFVLYAFAGSRGELPFLADWMPGILNHRGYSLDRLASQMVLGAEGIFGIPLGRRRHVHLRLRPVRRVSGSHRCGQVLHRPRLCRDGQATRRPGEGRGDRERGHGVDQRAPPSPTW